jgi:hypothetical protein
MRSVRVNGTWLTQIAGWSDLRYTHEWPRGCSETSWSMSPNVYHSSLFNGALVEVFDGGQRVWRGRLSEPPSDGAYAANGSWAEASDVLALDGSGNATKVPDTAIDAAISRGAVTWTRPSTLSSASWGTAAVASEAPMPLLDLLDQAMASLGKRWWVDPDGAIRASADPTTPIYYVPQAAAGRGLTLADDAYFSHITGRYFSASATWATVTVGDDAAASKWRRKEAWVDLSGMGVISSGTATADLNNRLALSGARMGFGENLNLGYGQVTTPGGAVVPLNMLRATGRRTEYPFALGSSGGISIRLMGVYDRTRVTGNPYTDITIAKSEFTEGASTVLLTPQGKAPRDLNEILSVKWDVMM